MSTDIELDKIIEVLQAKSTDTTSRFVAEGWDGIAVGKEMWKHKAETKAALLAWRDRTAPQNNQPVAPAQDVELKKQLERILFVNSFSKIGDVAEEIMQFYAAQAKTHQEDLKEAYKKGFIDGAIK